MQFILLGGFFLFLYIMFINNNTGNSNTNGSPKHRGKNANKYADVGSSMKKAVESMERLHQEQKIDQISSRYTSSSKPRPAKLNRSI